MRNLKKLDRVWDITTHSKFNLHNHMQKNYSKNVDNERWARNSLQLLNHQNLQQWLLKAENTSHKMQVACFYTE